MQKALWRRQRAAVPSREEGKQILLFLDPRASYGSLSPFAARRVAIAIGSVAYFASQFRYNFTVAEIKLALWIDSVWIQILKSSLDECSPPTHLDIRLAKLLPSFFFKYVRLEYHELINDFYFPSAAVSNKSISTEITFFLFHTHTRARTPHHDVTYKHCIHFASTHKDTNNGNNDEQTSVCVSVECSACTHAAQVK